MIIINKMRIIVGGYINSHFYYLTINAICKMYTYSLVKSAQIKMWKMVLYGNYSRGFKKSEKKVKKYV